MGYINTFIKLTIKVEDLSQPTRVRAIDEIIRPAIEDPRVRGFEVSKTEKVTFFRRGRYEK